MKNAARMALVAAAAYPLGRYHKLRWALMLAAFGATGRLESPGRLALRGVKELADSPELSELTDAVRSQLFDAARAAAMSAATSGIGSLTGRLNDQTEALRKPAADIAGGVSKGAGRSSTENDEDKVDQTEGVDADESVGDEERPRRRRPVHEGRSASRDRRDDGPTSRRRQAKDSGNGQGEPRAQRRPARSKDNGGGSPVRRGG